MLTNALSIQQEFLEMTKRIEGDRPLIPMVLYEYVRLIDVLEKKKKASDVKSLGLMFDPMIEVARKY
jgi:hypothetical protein